MINPFNNLQQLYFFHVVTVEGSIKGAAKKLHLTQPAVSIRIKTLEQELGSKLFSREFRKPILSPSGRTLHEYTTKIFSLTQEALSSIGACQIQEKVLRTGFVPTVSKGIVHDILKPLWKKYQTLQVFHGDYLALYDRLERGKLDLIIVDTEPKRIRKDLKVQEVAHRKLIFTAAPQFRHLRNNFPRSLDGVRFVSYTETNALRFQVDRFLNRNSVNPKIVAEVDELGLILSILIDGIGVGVIPDRAAQEMLDRRMLINLGEMKGVISRLWVVSHESMI